MQPAIPDLWSASYVALYAHYACVGMVGGLLTTMLQPYCLYVIEAPPVSSLTALEPQPSRLKIDLPLTRASPA